MELFIGIVIGLCLGAPMGMFILALVSVNHGAPKKETDDKAPPAEE